MTTCLRNLLAVLALATVPTMAHADMWCVVTFADGRTVAGQSACFPLTDAQLGTLPHYTPDSISRSGENGDGNRLDFSCFKAQADCNRLHRGVRPE
jgi:hypothetical protein